MKTAKSPGVQRLRSSHQLVVVATNREFSSLCAQSLKRLPGRPRVELRTHDDADKVASPVGGKETVLFVSRLSDIQFSAEKSTRAGESARHLLFVEGLPAEAMAARLPPLNIRSPQRLHISARTGNLSIAQLISRVIRGLTVKSDAPMIADAWIEGKRLFLLSPSFERMVVPFEALARFLGNDTAAVATFEIDDDGSFLYWPHADAHLGWTQLRQLVDPTSVLPALQKSLAFNRRYGAAIRAVREERGLKQSDISGVTQRHLRRVEHGEQAASKTILEALASAHALPLDSYLELLAQRLGSTGTRLRK